MVPKARSHKILRKMFRKQTLLSYFQEAVGILPHPMPETARPIIRSSGELVGTQIV